MKKALVLFSGGQDSATALAWALSNFESVETVGFTYGQRHSIELECRPKFLARLRELPGGVHLGEDHILSMPVLKEIGGTSLTGREEIDVLPNGLPSTFVPGRNLLFFVAAASLAWRLGARDLVGGMCETDYSGYPDCRNEALQTLARAIGLGVSEDFQIHTPLMHIDKAGTWGMAADLGGRPLVEAIRDLTHTCYVGNHVDFHPWGFGCGECPACELRRAGFEKWEGAND